MTKIGLAFAAANLLAIAALPRVFFKPGRLNAAWWLTATPFILAGIGVCAVAAGMLAPAALPAGSSALAAGAIASSCASIALIVSTARTHRSPVSLWHQDDDSPARLVTHGPYAHVRHPFYSAFLIALAACLLAAPSLVTLVAAICGVVQLTRTARREERRLGTTFPMYGEYVKRTGRFLPRLLPYRETSRPDRMKSASSPRVSTPSLRKMLER